MSTHLQTQKFSFTESNLLTLRSIDGYEMKYHRDSLASSCKYISDILTQYPDEIAIDLLFTGKQIDSFLRYIHRRGMYNKMEKEAGYWFDNDVRTEDGPKGREVLNFIIDVCQVADYLDYERSLNTWSLEEVVNSVYHVDIDMTDSYGNSLKLNMNTWERPLVTMKWYLKKLIDEDDPYLDMSPKEAKDAYDLKYKINNQSMILDMVSGFRG